MKATLDKPQLYSLREAAALMGLTESTGYRVISALVAKHGIPSRKLASAMCIDRSGLERIARTLNVTLDPNSNES